MLSAFKVSQSQSSYKGILHRVLTAILELNCIWSRSLPMQSNLHLKKYDVMVEHAQNLTQVSLKDSICSDDKVLLIDTLSSSNHLQYHLGMEFDKQMKTALSPKLLIAYKQSKVLCCV